MGSFPRSSEEISRELFDVCTSIPIFYPGPIDPDWSLVRRRVEAEIKINGDNNIIKVAEGRRLLVVAIVQSLSINIIHHVLLSHRLIRDTPEFGGRRRVQWQEGDSPVTAFNEWPTRGLCFRRSQIHGDQTCQHEVRATRLVVYECVGDEGSACGFWIKHRGRIIGDGKGCFARFGGESNNLT